MNTKEIKISGQASDVVVEGLAEEERKAALLAEIAKAEQAKVRKGKDLAKIEKAYAKKLAKLQALAEGIVDPDTNPGGRHNPQIFPESLRPANPGEEINGKPAKGWVVSIRCAECGEDRLINTQDAFQVRFCSPECVKAHKKSAATKAELSNLSVEELEARLATLKVA